MREMADINAQGVIKEGKTKKSGTTKKKKKGSAARRFSK